MSVARNPFTYLPVDVCDDATLPTMPVEQDCTNYAQPLSQVCGLVVLPLTAAPPVDWTTIEGWADVIDNADSTGTKARYIVGIGSFLPLQALRINVADERLQETRDRSYRFAYRILNNDTGHATFARKVERGLKNYSVWLETLGGRLIGGAYGMRPVEVDAQFPFAGDNASRENIALTMDFFFLNFPDITDLDLGAVYAEDFFWGDPETGEIWGDPGGGTGWGWQ